MIGQRNCLKRSLGNWNERKLGIWKRLGFLGIGIARKLVLDRLCLIIVNYKKKLKNLTLLKCNLVSVSIDYVINYHRDKSQEILI